MESRKNNYEFLPIFNLDPTNTYNITHAKYNDMNTLLVNNAIIYQNNTPFTYNIDFELSKNNNYDQDNIYSCIEYTPKTMENNI